MNRFPTTGHVSIRNELHWILIIKTKIQWQEANLGQNVGIGTMGGWVRGSFTPGLWGYVCMGLNRWLEQNDMRFSNVTSSCARQTTSFGNEKWCCFSERNTHQPRLKQITGCFWQLRFLLCLSLLSEFCLVELLVITGFCHNSPGEIIVGYQYEIYCFNIIYERGFLV